MSKWSHFTICSRVPWIFRIFILCFFECDAYELQLNSSELLCDFKRSFFCLKRSALSVPVVGFYCSHYFDVLHKYNQKLRMRLWCLIVAKCSKLWFRLTVRDSNTFVDEKSFCFSSVCAHPTLKSSGSKMFALKFIKWHFHRRSEFFCVSHANYTQLRNPYIWWINAVSVQA